MNRNLVFVLSVLMIGLVPAIVLTQSAFGLDPRAKACGADRWPVKGTFEVAQASQVRAHIPRMAPSPELDTSTAPAYVVLFEGPVELPVMHFAKPVTLNAVSGVVCVFVNSAPGYYADVDTTGWFR